ncbi:MAG: M23 family metallopeptidase [Christensenellaceae bacterium]|jgi:murein DD-endopeptidase MepM/ murein hydrolase activator NlpD|nr:M23 family metallopeptidase [Christensenellaceae bacterium]
MKKFLVLLLLPIFFVSAGFARAEERDCEEGGEVATIAKQQIDENEQGKKDFIKWIDFNVKREVLNAAVKKHKLLVEQGITDLGTCEILAYLAIKNSNVFKVSTDNARLKKLGVEDIRKYAENKYFKYYVESYHAVLDGIIGPRGEVVGFSPIAKGHWYNHYNDFGNSRGYGYKRRHLGNDLFGSVGAPIIAVEGGTITELGWNRYGGWRVGVRSDDSKRYYYYAHLRKNKPFAEGLAIGQKVSAGDLIGYLGVTGYSRKENTNMKTTQPHLHFGMQLIFDKSQEDGPTELWIDVYEIVKFLSGHRAEVNP